MNNILRLFALAALTGGAGTALAYKVATHERIAAYAAGSSLINDPSGDLLITLGLGTSIDDPAYILPSTTAARMTPRELITLGVGAEDAEKRALNHFIDVQNGGAAMSGPGDTYPSPTWILEDEGPIPGQEFSYADARRYFLQGVTASTRETRQRNLGLMFKSLGHVIHHLQDVSQPQHVRADAHCDDSPFTLDLWFWFWPIPMDQGCKTNALSEWLLYRPSGYEAYAASLGDGLPLGGHPVPDYGTFRTPRLFWIHGGKGNAEFTSRNFVSAGTNFSLDLDSTPRTIESDSDQPLPRGSDARVVSRDINSLEIFRPGALPMAGDISQVETPMVDAYTGFNGVNGSTSTLSILYEATQLSTGEVLAEPEYAFTLNSTNYQAAAAQLLPRAAAFSIGMLNYFFRGRIEVTPPASGIYAALDHAATSAAGQGFTKLKLRLRNVTRDAVNPSGSVIHEEMSPGTLTAIAKYMPNGCYQPDLLGEFDGSTNFSGPITRTGCSLLDYFTGQEKIVKSQPRAAVGLERENAQEFDFEFTEPIPVDAHDLYIQVVYEGKLGSETNAIAIGGTNISEATYLSVMNGSDYFAIDDQFYTPEEIRNDENLKRRVGTTNIDPEGLALLYQVNGETVAGPVTLDQKRHTRIALLVDADFKPPLSGPPPIDLTVHWGFARSGGGISGLPTNPIRNQLARAPATLSKIAVTRGITYWRMLYLYKGIGFPDPTLARIEALPPVDPNCAGIDPQRPSCVPAPAGIPLAAAFQ